MTKKSNLICSAGLIRLNVDTTLLNINNAENWLEILREDENDMDEFKLELN